MKAGIMMRTIHQAKKAELVTNKSDGAQLVKISFPFNMETVSRVKTLPGRKYDSTGKYWLAPLSIPVLKSLVLWEFILSKDLKEFMETSSKKGEQAPGFSKEKIAKILSHNWNRLLPFQQDGLVEIEKKNGRVLLADEMGLGKTIQAINWMLLNKKRSPVIIVVPATLKLNWKKEIERWAGEFSVQLLSGTKPEGVVIISDVVIINYDILPAWSARLKGIKAKVLILDECHYIKSNSAKRTKAVKLLAKGIPHVIAISGTPIVNRPMEMYNVINLVMPGLVGSSWDYGFRYCGARHNGFAWDFNGATNIPELHKILRESIMLRRVVKDVLKELPEKRRSFIPVELSNIKQYRAAEKDFVEFIRNQVEIDLKVQLREKLGEELADMVEFKDHRLEELQEKKVSKINILTEIETLKQLAVAGIMDSAVSWIQDFLESGEKLVIFATHKFVIERLMKEFGEVAVKVDGSVTHLERHLAVEKFQSEPKTKLFIGNMKAAGVGITLTAASNVLVLELPWSPGELIQAEDRIHRIGQEQISNIHFIIGVDTIVEKVAALLNDKVKVIGQVLDGEEHTKASILMDLINCYK